MDTVSNIVKGAVALLALVPGIAMLARAVPVPPPAETVLSFVTFGVGVAIVLAIALTQGLIQKIPMLAFAGVVLLFGVAGAFAAVQYADFARTHIVQFTDAENQEHNVVTPTNPSDELARIVKAYGGDYREALNSPTWGSRVETLLQAEARSTTMWLVAYLLTAQVLLITAIVGGAWRIAQATGTKPQV